MPTIANIRVGKADVDPDKPSHVKGIKEGNKGGEKHLTEEGKAKSAARSTGISPESRNPIDPKMPLLPPN